MERIWILSSVRSGSWLLCNLLKKATGLEFGEYMHWDFPKRLPYPPVCKVIRRHFLSYHSDKDKDQIEARLPGLKYIWLQRSDPFARAISLYFSILSKLWRTDVGLKKTAFLESKERNFPFLPELALECFAEVSSSYHNDWDSYLLKSDYHHIDYDDLILNPHDACRLALDYIGLKSDVQIEVDSVAMTRPQTLDFIDRLKTLVEKNSVPPVRMDSSENVYKRLAEAFHASHPHLFD